MKPSEIKDLRKRMSLNQTEFASILGISMRAVQTYEAGISTPNGKTYQQLLELNKQNSNIQAKDINSLTDFYDTLDAYKTEHGITWKDLGEVIDKKEAAMRVAFQRRSLNRFEVEKLTEHYLADGNGKDPADLLDELSTQDITMYVVKNQEQFMQNMLFKEFADKLAYKKIIEMNFNK